MNVYPIKRFEHNSPPLKVAMCHLICVKDVHFTFTHGYSLRNYRIIITDIDIDSESTK